MAEQNIANAMNDSLRGFHSSRFFRWCQQCGACLVDLMTTVGEWASYVLASVPGFGMLVTFQAIDIASGVAVACGKGKLNSSIGRKGLSRKVGQLCLFGGALAIEHWMPGAPPISAISAIFLSWGEIQSIVENADELGIPLPKSLVEAMKQRRALSEKQLDKAMAVITPQLNVEFAEVNAKRVDQVAHHVEQHTESTEIKADSVVLRGRDTDANQDTVSG